MDTLTIQSIEALKEKGTIGTVLYDTGYYGEKWVGLKYKNSCTFHWFSEFVWTDGKTTLEFEQSNSGATGSVKKGFRHSRKVELGLRNKIEKLNK